MQSIYDWEEPGIGRSLAYMLGTAIIFFFILWAIEYRIIPRLMAYLYGFFERALPTVIANDEIDNDVKDERNRVLSMNPYDLQSESLVLRNVTKFYGDFLAVKKLCVAVKRCEFHKLLDYLYYLIMIIVKELLNQRCSFLCVFCFETEQSVLAFLV